MLIHQGKRTNDIATVIAYRYNRITLTLQTGTLTSLCADIDVTVRLNGLAFYGFKRKWHHTCIEPQRQRTCYALGR